MHDMDKLKTLKSLDAGATDAQLAEATTVAAAIRAGGAITHGRTCSEPSERLTKAVGRPVRRAGLRALR